MNSSVDLFIESSQQWNQELLALRSIVLSCGLKEEFKWKQPCYTYNSKNILILANFKKNCAIGFFKGALLSNNERLLTKPGENSQHIRQIRFTSTQSIADNQDKIKAYIFEAIEIEKAGLKIITNSNTMPQSAEMKAYFLNNPAVETAFYALTPGRQRAYLLFINSAKQSKTRETRIQTYSNRILNGFGLNDCTCGLSQRMPNCDGSHKLLNKTPTLK